MRKSHYIILPALLFLSSCIVQSPKYTTFDKMTSIQLGMSKEQVEVVLDVEPYDLKARTDTSNTYIYIYRTVDRRTLAVITRPKNGAKSTGKYVQMEMEFTKDGRLIHMNSCNLCPDNLIIKSKVDIDKVLAFFTVTVPVILIYFGVQQ